MELAEFIYQLIAKGAVSVKADNLPVIKSADEKETLEILRKYYKNDIAEIPGEVPAFNESAAVWSARYFYYAVHLVILRELGEDVINRSLLSYPEAKTASAIYSADLVLRRLPDLLLLAKGMAPSDMLVKELTSTACQWPFSSVGIKPEYPIDESVILSHFCLRTIYIDRIIENKDLHRVKNTLIKSAVTAVTGNHERNFWPDFELNTKNEY